jgi:hypothetical protein
MRAKRCDEIVRANSGAAAVQLDLFFSANHSIDPGWGTVWVGCGWLRCLAASNSCRASSGPYAVDSTSSYVANNVRDLWGMQVANLKTGEIITATIPHMPGDAGLLHGIGWTPDQTEVWANSSGTDPHVYVWDMRNPMVPVLRKL